MKLLLDECVVHDLKRDLVGHEVATVVEAGFGAVWKMENCYVPPQVNLMCSEPWIAVFLFNKILVRFKSRY